MQGEFRDITQKPRIYPVNNLCDFHQEFGNLGNNWEFWKFLGIQPNHTQDLRQF